MNTSNAITSTTQQFLDIYDISNDLVIMKSGATSLVITVTAMNFGLLAEEEQDAIIYGYAGLLNSLNYPIQIVIRSQTKDVTSYLNLLKAKEEETTNRLRKDQIRKYREFVADLVQERNVLDKKFYVVIPATALELGLVSTQSVIPGVKNPDISTFDRSLILERARNLLEPKRDHLMAQFSRIGLFSRQLKTQELIQLFYTIYNPESSEGQKMTDSNNYSTAVVEGSLEEEIFGNNRSKTPENLRQPISQTTMTSESLNTAQSQTAPVASPFATAVSATPEPEVSASPGSTTPVSPVAEQQPTPAQAPQPTETQSQMTSAFQTPPQSTQGIISTSGNPNAGLPTPAEIT